MGMKIIQTAKSIPEKIISNRDLEQTLDTSDEWIKKRTGIEERHVTTTETTNSMATQVAVELLSKSDWQAEDIDLIIVATMSPTYLTPSVAAVVQGNIKANQAIAFDINVACAGFVYGLSMINDLLQTGRYQRAILIGSENLSKLVDWTDRGTAVLFGDGAAGALIENDPLNQSRVIGQQLTNFGALGDNLTAGKLGAKDSNYFFKMNGRRVYEFATKEVTKSIETALLKAKLETNAVDQFILHQANQRIIESVAKKLKVDPKLFPINIAKYGNTAAASEPILLAELAEQNKIQRGQTLVLSGFGGGLSVGTIIIKF